MDESAQILIIIGALLLIGLGTEFIGRRTKVPRVSFLLVIGFLIGPSVLHLIPSNVTANWFPLLAKIALAMIGFLLGGKLTIQSLRKVGKYVLGISLTVVIITALIVFFGLLLIRVPIDIALILAGLSAATAPAATADVVFELKAKSKFSQILLDIVAIDDAWTLILFSFVMVLVHFFYGQTDNITKLLLDVSWKIGGAFLIGIIFGIPMAFLSGRIKHGEPTILEAVGIVFIVCGIALWLHVSFILTSMILGFVVTNLAKHHKRAFHAIEGIEWPFMILFFILAGASLNIKMLFAAGLAGIGYIIFRFIGRIVGGWLGSTMVQADKSFRRWIGLALMPQAGLAIGMGLVAAQTYPVITKQVLPIVLGSTIIFEIIGPILTRKALDRVGQS